MWTPASYLNCWLVTQHVLLLLHLAFTKAVAALVLSAKQGGRQWCLVGSMHTLAVHVKLCICPVDRLYMAYGQASWL